MITNVYCVYDRAAELYTSPLFFDNDKVAIRAFTSSVHEGTLLFDYPDDYTLVQVATYDDKTGIFESVEPRVVVTALDIKEAYENEIQRPGKPEEPIEG